MPVRLLTSSVLKWPDQAVVEREVRQWAIEEAARRPELIQLGCFGSYARGDAGVGSDLDLVAVVRQTSEPFERRAVGWDLTRLPVPAEILVYTEKEWCQLREQSPRFARTLATETVWLTRLGDHPYPMSP